jgi:SAM-dependent methyltransferase
MLFMEHDATGRQATYTAEQFAPLFAAEDRHFWFRSRNQCLEAALRSVPDFTSIREVLEVGCGTGVVLAQLQRLFPNGRIIGMDLFDEGLKFARQRFKGTLIQGDVFQYSFDRSFDLIGAFDVIEHLDEDEKILRRFYEQLRPGGHLIITVPAHQGLWSYFDEVAHHRRRYAVADLERKLADAGFSRIYVTQFMSALFPLMWIKRRLLGEKATKLSEADAHRRQAAVESDLKINPLINWFMDLLLWPEAFFVSRHWRIPLGTSLMALATRPEKTVNSISHV